MPRRPPAISQPAAQAFCASAWRRPLRSNSRRPCCGHSPRDTHASALLTEHYGFEDPTGGLRDNATDVAIVRPPFAATGLDLIVVASERRYAAVAAEHRLAHRATVTFDDVVDEPWIEIVESDPVWCDFWRVSDRRATPPRFGAYGRTMDDLLEAARAGRAIGLVPASVANSQKWPGLAFIEVTDLPPSDIAVAWRADGRSALVDEFIAIATELGHPRTTATASP